jgi:hypothetical protein
MLAAARRHRATWTEPRTDTGLTPTKSSEAAAIRGDDKTSKPVIDLFPEHCGVQGTKARINPLA